MKICDKHWAQLRQTIARYGLEGIGVRSAKELMEIAQAELEGENPNVFDPLFESNNMIWAKALEMGGMYLLGVNPSGENDGEYCPVCEAYENRFSGYGENDERVSDEIFYEYWMDGPVLVCMEEARNRGLISKIH